MRSISTTLASVRRDTRGVTALEYGLIAAAIVGIGLLGFGPLMSSLSDEFSKVATEISPDAPPATGGGGGS